MTAILTAVLDGAAALPVPAVLVVVAVLLVVESGTLVGVVLPGTTFLVALGIWSHVVPGALPAAVAVAAAATVTGAHLGWWRGRTRTHGSRWQVLETRAEQARRWLAGRGPLATAALLVCGHWAAAARPVMPRVAGGAGVPYRIAGPALIASGTAWATTIVLLGNRAGAHVLTHAGWVPVVVVALLVGALVLRARRGNRRAEVDENRLIHLSSDVNDGSTRWAGGPRRDRPELAARALPAPGPGRR